MSSKGHAVRPVAQGRPVPQVVSGVALERCAAGHDALVAAIASHAAGEGCNLTAFPGLRFHRASQPYTFQKAQAWGLVWKVVPDAELDATSTRVGEKLAALAPHVVSRYKKVLNEVGLAQFQRALDAEAEAQRAL